MHIIAITYCICSELNVMCLRAKFNSFDTEYLMFLNKLIQLSEWLIDLLTHKDNNLIQSGKNHHRFGWVTDQMTPANKIVVSILNESVF